MDSGLYQLVIRLRKGHTIQVGRLGRFQFPSGTYVYTGSAKAGLEARISRHKRKEKKLKWHVDYLLNHAEVLTVKRYFGLESECELNQKVGRLPGSMAIVSGFGSSDCSCLTHLFHFSRNPTRELLKARDSEEHLQFFDRSSERGAAESWALESH